MLFPSKIVLQYYYQMISHHAREMYILADYSKVHVLSFWLHWCHGRWVGREVLNFATCLQILLILNNRSIIHFCRWGALNWSFLGITLIFFLETISTIDISWKYFKIFKKLSLRMLLNSYFCIFCTRVDQPGLLWHMITSWNLYAWDEKCAQSSKWIFCIHSNIG